MKHWWFIVFMCVAQWAVGQAELSGVVRSEGKPVGDVLVLLHPGSLQAFTTPTGKFTFKNVKPGTYTVQAHSVGTQIETKEITIAQSAVSLDFELKRLEVDLEGVTVIGHRESTGLGMARLSSVDGVAIYAAKKNEVIIPKDLAGNKAVNNARQVYAKVPGLNIWESDQAGVQLGIGARGLSPDRTSNFNTRQQGYDIAADALGYPESYYTPPVEALQRIELVRGAASLQYGTQFGGMLNFVLKAPPRKDGWEYIGRATAGSYGLFSTFHGAYARQGTTGVSAFYQFKHSDGWRPNSELNQHTAFVGLDHQLNDKWKVKGEFTHMQYLAHQPGGLTDAEFNRDPTISKRERNWFQVKWNVMAVHFEGRLSDRTRIDIRNFGLLASREALGNLSRINRQDAGGNRTYINGEYQNVGNETRLLHNYTLFNQSANALVGVRVYRGNSSAEQGDADDSNAANFSFINPNNLEGSDYTFPSWNMAVFTEHVFRPTNRLSITPGIRYEYIQTDAEGWYKQITKNFAGEVIAEQRFNESRTLDRNFVLMGIGASYRLGEGAEAYANFSQNYRAITFSDIRIDNPNMVVDENISDEFGYNADLGIRGSVNKVFHYDVGLYYLAYNNRIGFVTGVDSVTFLEQRIRTNVGDSRSFGVEAFAELDFYKLLVDKESKTAVSLFVNAGLLHATYIQSEDALIEGNDVELVPPVNVKTGVQFKHKGWKGSVQLTHVAAQFTDAYNTVEPTSTAISGEIPAYTIADVSLGYKRKWWSLEGGVNNLLDQTYFTRRATGYPGPGIIPADPRMVYLTFGVELNGKFKKDRK